MSTINGLKPEAVKTLEAIYAHVDQHGVAPTYAELAEQFGRSISTIGNRIAVLEARGYLCRPGYKAPTVGRMTLTDKRWSR